MPAVQHKKRNRLSMSTLIVTVLVFLLQQRCMSPHALNMVSYFIKSNANANARAKHLVSTLEFNVLINDTRQLLKFEEKREC